MRRRETTTWERTIDCLFLIRIPTGGHPTRGTEPTPLGMCPDQESNQWPFTLQNEAQPTEPHQSGLHMFKKVNHVILDLVSRKLFPAPAIKILGETKIKMCQAMPVCIRMMPHPLPLHKWLYSATLPFKLSSHQLILKTKNRYIFIRLFIFGSPTHV